MQKFSETIIEGRLALIKRTYQNPHNGSSTISFVVERHNDTHSHHYLISARSNTDRDIFGIADYVGIQVKCHCYVNGRVKQKTNGDYHTVELALHKIEAL